MSRKATAELAYSCGPCTFLHCITFANDADIFEIIHMMLGRISRIKIAKISSFDGVIQKWWFLITAYV